MRNNCNDAMARKAKPSMSTKPTHEERLIDSLDYNPDTGLFFWKRPPRCGVSAGWAAGCAHSKGYLEIGFETRRYFLHRVAWRIVTGAWPALHIDHINGDKADNRIANLRDVSRSVNLQNQRAPKSNNTTGWLGVRRSYKRFVAQISYGGTTRFIGSFDTGEEAHAAYLAEKRRRHEGCTL